MYNVHVYIHIHVRTQIIYMYNMHAILPSLTLGRVGGVEGYCNRFVCLSVCRQNSSEPMNSRCQIIQGSKVTIGIC